MLKMERIIVMCAKINKCHRKIKRDVKIIYWYASYGLNLSHPYIHHPLVTSSIVVLWSQICSTHERQITPMASQQINWQATCLCISLTEQCVSLALAPFFYESFVPTLHSGSQNLHYQQRRVWWPSKRETVHLNTVKHRIRVAVSFSHVQPILTVLAYPISHSCFLLWVLNMFNKLWFGL